MHDLEPLVSVYSLGNLPLWDFKKIIELCPLRRVPLPLLKDAPALMDDPPPSHPSLFLPHDCTHNMLVFQTFVACALILRVGGAPLLQPHMQSATTYVQPSLDSFYDPPPGLDKLKPGDIIRERMVPTNIAGTRSVYQVLYATLDTMGRMDATVTTLYAPETPAPGPPKILSLQLPQDSAARDCA